MIPIKLYLLVSTVPEEGGLYSTSSLRNTFNHCKVLVIIVIIIIVIVGYISIVMKYSIVGFVLFR